MPRLSVGLEAFEATANNSTASYLPAPGVDLPRIGGTRVGGSDWTPHPSTLAAVGLRQELYDFGRISAIEDLSRATVAVETGRYAETRLDLDLAVRRSFYAVLAAKGIETAADSAWQRAQVNRDAAAAGVTAGLRKPIELTRAEADLARFAVGRVRARAGVLTAESVFAAVVGVPDRVLDAAGEPPPVTPVPPLSELLADALAREPRLAQARAEVARQAAQTRSIAASRRPDLAGTATLSGRAGEAPPSSGTASADLVPRTPNWDGGLVFSWPLFDPAVIAEEDVSRQYERARDAEVLELEHTVAAGVQRAWVDVGAAAEAVPALEKALEAARANYAQASARFEAGLGSAVELADAQALLADSEMQLAAGRYAYAAARAELARIAAEES